MNFVVRHTKYDMLVYLDQNKWIQLARVFNGKEKNKKISQIPRLVAKNRVFLPISAIHYMETSRISDCSRRERLGRVMWNLSKGITIASARSIAEHEIEVALSKMLSENYIHEFSFLGKGASHAFDEPYSIDLPHNLKDLFERALLTGEEVDGESPKAIKNNYYRKTFHQHLVKLKQIKTDLPSNKWEAAIYCICWVDILEPFNSVLIKNKIDKSKINDLDEDGIRIMLDSMPLRKADIHLHKQVLKNNSYCPKKTDLEDWAGLSIGAMYCDILVCEKHFKDLISRDRFETKARIINDLSELPEIIDDA